MSEPERRDQEEESTKGGAAVTAAFGVQEGSVRSPGGRGIEGCELGGCKATGRRRLKRGGECAACSG
eukprot:5376811-Pleurochrysis_carterae.AAC.1